MGEGVDPTTLWLRPPPLPTPPQPHTSPFTLSAFFSPLTHSSRQRRPAMRCHLSSRVATGAKEVDFATLRLNPTTQPLPLAPRPLALFSYLFNRPLPYPSLPPAPPWVRSVPVRRRLGQTPSRTHSASRFSPVPAAGRGRGGA